MARKPEVAELPTRLLMQTLGSERRYKRIVIIGGIAAVVTVMILGPAGHMLALPVPIAAYGIFDWRLWLLFFVTGLAAGIIAMVTARITVLRQLARMP